MSRTDGEKRNSQMIKGMGLVNEVFDAEKLEQLHGDIGVGHVRYSTGWSQYSREYAAVGIELY